MATKEAIEIGTEIIAWKKFAGKENPPDLTIGDIMQCTPINAYIVGIQSLATTRTRKVEIHYISEGKCKK